MSDVAIIVCPNCATANRLPPARLGQSPKCGRCKRPLFSGAPVEVDTTTFEKHIGTGSVPVVADFWASWCGPCRMMAPAFAAAASELEPEVRFVKVDTEAEQSLAARYNIRSIPTLILFANGREAGRQAGALDKTSIVRWVRGYLSSSVR